MATQQISVLFIVGPTASGKTDLALHIAQHYGGEIICADSRTVYKGLNIATAKPTKIQKAKVPHWGLDLIEPSQQFSAAQFKAYAVQKLSDITKRGKLPIIVGGTGLYIDGLLFDYKFGDANPALRAELETLSTEELQSRITLAGIEMPENKKNNRYLIRAIEQGGVNKQKSPLMSGALVIGLLPSREVLDFRIERRAHIMMSSGALKEAEALFVQYGFDASAASAPFYKAFMPHFKDGIPAQQCVERFILNDRQLSKRQVSWFKRNPHIHWFEDAAAAQEFVQSKLESDTTDATSLLQ